MAEIIKKKNIITIAGRPGAGKSTASKSVAEQLGYGHFSSGDLFRAIGKERGYDVHKTNLVAEAHKEIDHLVDQRLRDIGATQDELVIDSRMAWHWIPGSLKVYLDLDLEIAARRIIAKLTPERLEYEHIPNDPKEYARILQERLDSESKRYKNLYDANPYNPSNYDLVVDTGTNTPDEVTRKIVDAYQKWLSAESVKV